ncbi:MAG: DMT family transporter [Caryophanon sp.]|nr:DMT family transporter [Caryophanon sp.]
MKGVFPFISSMILFSTIGVVVRQIDLASSERALLSSAIACLFLTLVMKLQKKRFDWPCIKQQFPLLLLCSAALAANWIFLYAAYNHTTIANASLGYYCAPIFVMLLAPIVLKERLQFKKIVCVIVALSGLSLIVLSGMNATNGSHLFGISLSIGAAIFYATVMLCTQFIADIDRLTCNVVQLGLAVMLLLPYVFITEGTSILSLSMQDVPFLFILGIVNTGLGFWLFFVGLEHLSGQRSAMLSYVDPLSY